ncbi:MAG: hypothetical protein ACYTGB_18370, partial [Planctomycetota bacterium]
AKYEGVVSSNLANLHNISMLGTGPDGTLYVRNVTSPAVWDHNQLLALDKDGKYLRTLIPFSSKLSKEETAPYGVMELAGRPAPCSLSTGKRINVPEVFSGNHGPKHGTLAVSSDGKNIYILAGRPPAVPPGIVRISTDGSCPQAPFNRPLMPGKKYGIVRKQPAAVALSADGKHLFMTGLSSDPNGNKPLNAVYKVPVPSREGASVFFGDPQKKGAGKGQLGGAPAGLAIDGKGNVLIADSANGRIVIVAEKDGTYVGEMKTGKILCLGASRKTGAVYVTVSGKGAVRILKFDSPKAAKPSAELTVRGFPSHIMTVDANAPTPVIWFGERTGLLLRIEDTGGKLVPRTVSAGIKAPTGTQEGYVGLEVDRMRKEVYVRNGHNGGLWHRFIEKTGKLETLRIPDGDGGGGHGLQLTPAPDGNLYALKWKFQFYKFGRDGKPLPWKSPLRPQAGDYFSSMPNKTKKSIERTFKPHISNVPVAMGELPHTLGVRWSDGHLFVQEALISVAGSGARTTKALHEHSPTGERVTGFDSPVIWKMTDQALGPKFDPQGNIYIAEIVRPKGWVCPPELSERMTAAGAKKGTILSVAGGMYGSIVKFSPKGGTFHFGTGKGSSKPNKTGEYVHVGARDTGPNPYRGELKLDGLKTAEYDYFFRTLKPVKITGAEWVHPGIGHVGIYGCNCENVTFDVDEFGRVFIPDLMLFRVRVIDTAGNAVTHFGTYGNPDDVIGEKRTCFSWLVGVGATDKYVYTGDAMNRQMLRSKITYAVEETCEVR